MNREEKHFFVEQLFITAKREVKEKIDRVPMEWDGIELRWFISELVMERFGGWKRDKKRYRAYRNEVIVNNLF